MEINDKIKKLRDQLGKTDNIYSNESLLFAVILLDIKEQLVILNNKIDTNTDKITHTIKTVTQFIE